MIKKLILTNGNIVILKNNQFFQESETKRSIELWGEMNGLLRMIKRFQSRHIIDVIEE